MSAKSSDVVDVPGSIAPGIVEQRDDGNTSLMLVFPSPIFRFNNLDIDPLNVVRAALENRQFFPNFADGNYTSEDFMLQEEEVFAPLVEVIEARAAAALRTVLRYRLEDLKINTMWCNVHNPEPAASHFLHEHANSFFSGTYYAEVADDKSAIVFDTPLRTKVISPEIEEQNYLNTMRHAVPVNTGDLLIWPSELRHGILPYESRQRRITVSFNMMPKGKLGGPTWNYVY